jgi:hypothetical protein
MAVADRSRCRTWHFTFDLKASDTGAASQLQALLISPVRIARIQKASIISFSYYADGSLDIKGYIYGGAMLLDTVQTWLTNHAISNLQLHAISGSPGALVCTVCTECAHSKCAQIFFGLFISVHT